MKHKLIIILSLALAQILTCSAQDRKYVTGRVTDAITGKPLQGISVSSGKDVSVLTDSAGCYKVPVSSFDGQLTLSAPSFVKRIVSLQGAHQKDFKMYSDAFDSLKDGKKALNDATSMSIDEELGTRYGSDLRVISHGEMPGIGSAMFIRGYNSLFLNTQPLVVIDGVVQNMENVESVFQGFYINPLSNFDISTIDHVTILKDASSFYGSKGANGAILIYTKRGKATATKIDFHASTAFSFKPKTVRMMDASQFRSLASELIKTQNGNDQANAFEGFLNDESDLTKNISYKTYHNNHDWLDDVYHMGNKTNLGLNVEGGDDVAKYALSVSYLFGKPVVRTTDYDRLNTHFNADISLKRNISLAAGFDFTYITRSLLDDGVNPYTSAPYLALIKSPLLMPYQYTRDGLNYTSKLSDVDVFGVSNPVSLLNNSVNKYTQYRFGVDINPKWQINSMFDLSSLISYNMNAVKEHYFSPIEGMAAQLDADGNEWQNTIKDQSINQGLLFIDTRLHFGKSFAKVHQLNATLGFRMQSNSYKSNYSEGHNSGSDKVVNLSVALEGKKTTGRKDKVNNAAFYLQAGYNFNNKYDLWGILTTEACNTFGSEADGGFKMFNGVWATFPSVGASWNVSSERFMKHLPVISQLKLRLEYGETGNDALNASNRYAYLSAIMYQPGTTGLQIGNLDNQKQKWETTRKFNIGLDLGLFNDRINISFDYFRHKTSDLLMYSEADIISGLAQRIYNGGNLKNYGFEMGLDARVINRKWLKWNTMIGISHYNNKLTSLPGGTTIYEIGDGAILLQEGLPIGKFYGYRTVSENGSIVFATEEQAQTAGLQTWNTNESNKLTFHAGDVHFADIDSNGLIDEKDRTVIGDANPALTGSWANRFVFGRFSLNLLFSFSLGGDVYNYQRHTLESMKYYYNQTKAVEKRWKSEGQLTDIPRAVYGDPMGNSRFSDRFIEDGSYLKLQRISLSYDLDLPWYFINGLTVWAAMNNVYTWTHYLGSDPEVSYGNSALTQGVDYGLTPLCRSLQMGINVHL